MCLPLTKNELVCNSAALQSPQGEQVFPGTTHCPLGSAQCPEQRVTLPTPVRPENWAEQGRAVGGVGWRLRVSPHRHEKVRALFVCMSESSLPGSLFGPGTRILPRSECDCVIACALCCGP